LREGVSKEGIFPAQNGIVRRGPNEFAGPRACQASRCKIGKQELVLGRNFLVLSGWLQTGSKAENPSVKKARLPYDFKCKNRSQIG
jgi:hypothetical protein